MVPPNADMAAHAAPPQNSRLVVFTVIMRILYQIRGGCAAALKAGSLTAVRIRLGALFRGLSDEAREVAPD